MELKKLIQTRLHTPPSSRGNCFPTVIACLMGYASPEDVLQVQELYDKYEDNNYWATELDNWLTKRDWEWLSITGHKEAKEHEYYLVTGNTKRNKETLHVCIYKNGKLYHDPHPDQSGLINEKYFEIIQKIKQ